MAIRETMKAVMQRRLDAPALVPVKPAEGFDVRVWHKTIYLAGTVRTNAEADELVATINALKTVLPDPVPTIEPSRDDDDAIAPAPNPFRPTAL